MNSVGQVEFLRRFVDWLGRYRREQVEGALALRSGFEGWLKTEIASWLMRNSTTGCEPALLPPFDKAFKPNAESHGVGVEYRARLKQRYGKRQSKLVDLWFTLEKTDATYCELKLAFDNHNAGKQVQSWVADLKWLQELHRNEYAQRLVSVLFIEPRARKRFTKLLQSEGARHVSDGLALDPVLEVWALASTIAVPA